MIIKTTIKDVAKKAGVSISTVSRVINGMDRVSKSTTKKVQLAVETLNFYPDHVARAMINKKTQTIGLIVPQLSNEYWALMSEVIQNQLWLNGYTTLISSTDNETDKENAYLKMYIERRVDGIIYCAPSQHLSGDQQQMDMLKRSGVPIVTLDPSVVGISCVTGDHLLGSFNAVEHLIQLGHRNIAYIGGPVVSIEREFGYRKAMMMHRLNLNEALILTVNGQTPKEGYRALQQLLASGEKFDALFCGNDMLAFGAIKALEEANIRVPEDVAVVGYDDIQSASLFKPTLTTVRQPISDIGKELIGLLLQCMDQEVGNRTPRKIVVPTELIVRESSGVGKQDETFFFHEER
ncbi:LacI family transcriptional regulator [Paenibacillus psychroresistens]|uniref:LacI family transcriptional regulator n=1 Tax=Paenibacillus psychroresistens TaxID=1778678 RepID=A0A6B8RHK7_9BACL|nr:LacI family DNA-binding transcriptional regulator [Paenibacillus psychroresistens]QGQ95214.1 LacI family transcriptional regulator [Paenibacillus psychroresistens]